MMDPKIIEGLELKLGYVFNNKFLLENALIHRSFIHESKETKSNERLEFLGDTVLQLLVTQELYLRFYQEEEGVLSKLRSSIVNEQTLVDIADKLNLHDYLCLGIGEKKNQRDSVKANAIEAILGAVYLDGGLENASCVWNNLTAHALDSLYHLSRLEHFDAKSKLQEFCLDRWKKLPQYHGQSYLIGKETFFRVTLIVMDRPLLSTFGPSKKKAETNLAELCLKNNLHFLTERYLC